VGFDVWAFERHDSFDYRGCSNRMVRDQMERIEQAAMKYDSAYLSFRNPCVERPLYLAKPSQFCSAQRRNAILCTLIEVPQTGRFVIAAQAQRSVGDSTEQYYWLQLVSLDGQQQRVQNLSNNNLTSTTGTSALILTKD
jgi:hypothetical protein